MSQLNVCISPRRAPSETSSGSFPPTEALTQETPTPAAAGWTSGSCSTSSEGRGPLPVGSHKKNTEVQVMPQASLCLLWALGRTDRCVVQRQMWTHRRREKGRFWAPDQLVSCASHHLPSPGPSLSQHAPGLCLPQNGVTAWLPVVPEAPIPPFLSPHRFPSLTVS